MIKGLSQNEYQLLKRILSNFNGSFHAYGSRVVGNFTKSSDLDILVKNCPQISKLKTELYESKLPFIVNITNFNDIDKKFYDQIKQDLVLIKE